MWQMNLALNVFHKAVRLPGRLRKAIRRRHKFNPCNVAEGASMHRHSRVWNFQADKNSIAIGARSHILGELLVCAHGGSIRIGDACNIGEGSRIWSAASIAIGDRALISHGVNIHDTTSHSLSAASRHDHFISIIASGHPMVVDDVSAPIVIEDDAWIGFNATILKGVTIGKGAVVGAASLVTKDVPAYTVVAGNPANPIGTSMP